MPPKKITTASSRGGLSSKTAASNTGKQQGRIPGSRGAPAAGKGPGGTSVSTATRSQPTSTRSMPGGSKSSAPKGGIVGKGKSGGIVTVAGKGGKVAQGKESNPSTKKPVQTKEDLMARRIQTTYRGYRCRKLLFDLKKKKNEYDTLMEKLEREAYLYMVKLEQERTEQQFRREEEERRKKREQAKRIKRMLEAAFDGEITEIKSMLSEVATLYKDHDEIVVARYQYKLVDCTDPNNNTPLSEAAAGGDSDTIKLLVSLGADPNSKGQFGRTPLYRAAFAGHLDAVKALLECGSDPRLIADDGATAEQISAQPVVEEYIQKWDIEMTNQLLVSFGAEKTKRLEKQLKLRQEEETKIQDEIGEVEKENSTQQKQLSKAYEELNKRIYEHDTYGAEKADITLQAVHDAEEHLELCKLHAEEARKNLQQVRLKLRMKKKEYNDIGDGDEDEETKADVVINIRELDDVLLRDVGNKIAESDKWPLIIDSKQLAATFLRYRDTNYLNVCSPKHMEPETIRMALLGAIRYGKFAVIDLMDIEDIWSAVTTRFDSVQKDLLANLMSKDLMKEEKYLTLVKKSDGPEYSPKLFMGARTQNFKFVVITQLPSPAEELLKQCYTIRIHTPDMSQ